MFFLKGVQRWTTKGVSVVALLCALQGCSVAHRSEDTPCPGYDASVPAIRERVIASANVDRRFTPARCESEAGASGVYEEACIIESTDPRGEPTFAAGQWSRQTITFVPNIVRRLAQQERVTLATQFEKDSTQVFADANLGRGIVYRQFDACQ